MSGVKGKHVAQQSDHATYDVRIRSSSMPKNEIWLRLVFERGGILSLILPSNFDFHLYRSNTTPTFYKDEITF
jgi:hypothetical protein